MTLDGKNWGNIVTPDNLWKSIMGNSTRFIYCGNLECIMEIL